MLLQWHGKWASTWPISFFRAASLAQRGLTSTRSWAVFINPREPFLSLKHTLQSSWGVEPCSLLVPLRPTASRLRRALCQSLAGESLVGMTLHFFRHSLWCLHTHQTLGLLSKKYVCLIFYLSPWLFSNVQLCLFSRQDFCVIFMKIISSVTSLPHFWNSRKSLFLL